jgi:hypothetical protein
MPPLQPFRDDLGGHLVWLPLGAVHDLLVVGHAEEVVERYRAAMAAGARFPPVAVVRLGRWYLLADGHKRLRAFRALAAAAPAGEGAGSGAGGDRVLVERWSWWRWLADQGRQARGNLRKNVRILALARRDPAAAAALAVTTLAHWRRVAQSLGRLVWAGGRRLRPPLGG